MTTWLRHPQYRFLKLSAIGVIAVAVGYLVFQGISSLFALDDPRNQSVRQWATGDSAGREELITVRRDTCPGAPFILPAAGFIGLLYEDPREPYSKRKPHQGIDIFSNAEPGITPVYAAYAGYVTREEAWRSSLIIRIPEDPLRPGIPVWLYYTHLADREGNDFIEDAFPPGTKEEFVKQGTLLGYTGDYNGNSPRNVWVQLHFSIVKDDGRGQYTNELDFNNTLDPSPYLGMDLNFRNPTAGGGCLGSE